MRVELRLGRAGDVFRLQEIERAAAELFRGLGLIDVDAMGVAAVGDHMTSIEQGLSFVAEVEGRIAGFAFGEMHFDDAYLRELDVDPAYQKRGIGRELVARFVSGARAKQAKAVYLSTFRDPPWNAPFYRKLGFVDVARGDYLRWMEAIAAEQAKFLDIGTRVFMRRTA